MLVKAVAHHTTAAFIRVVGSEFVQKYLGEGPRMVRDVFRMARENAPAIIFIDEIDAIATKRFDAQTGADREVQRILLELLNQMDGFDQSANVKVIMATNRADTLVSLTASPDDQSHRRSVTNFRPILNFRIRLCCVLEGWIGRSNSLYHRDERNVSFSKQLRAR